MSSAVPQKELFAHPAPPPATIFVNDRVCAETEQSQRVLFVHGIVFSHYSIQDRSAEAYAMVQLFESGYADQNDIARCFGYSARTLRRYQERLKVGGLSALARPRGRPRKERIEKFRRYVNTTRAAVFVGEIKQKQTHYPGFRFNKLAGIVVRLRVNRPGDFGPLPFQVAELRLWTGCSMFFPDTLCE